MSALDGFRAFDFSEGVPYASFTQNGITFNKSVTLKLGEPEYAKFLINPETKQVAVQVCDSDDKNATVFYRPKASGVLSVRWNARDLLNTLERVMGWNLKEMVIGLTECCFVRSGPFYLTFPKQPYSPKSCLPAIPDDI